MEKAAVAAVDDCDERPRPDRSDHHGVRVCFGCVEKALAKAHAAGRAEGIEEAAAKADADCAEWNVLAERSIGAGHAGLASDRRLRADACRMTAAEIRALLSEPRAKREGEP